VRRNEDRRLITGVGRYAGDLQLDRTVHLVVFRSTVAHGRISSIDTREARSMHGVLAVWTAADLPASALSLMDRVSKGLEPTIRPVLARQWVRYVGEPIAAVVAENQYVAVDAAERIAIELEQLAAAGDLATATADGAAQVHPGIGIGNVTGHQVHQFGDIDPAFAGDSVTVSIRLEAKRIMAAPMEPRAVTASPDGGGVTVWTSTQSVFEVRRQLSLMLGLEETEVRVVAPDVGGGFGGKGPVYPEELLVALAAMRLDRPVRWVATRTEEAATSVHAHGSIFELELAASPEGKLRGIRGQILHDVGAYSALGSGQPYNYTSHMISTYVLPAMSVSSDLVFTNAAPTGYIRGGGRPLGNFAIERLIDQLAVKLRLDPAEIRRRNLIQPDQMPYDTGYPAGGRTVVYDSGDYPRLLRVALESSGYEKARQSPPKFENKLFGIGLACYVESTGWGGNEPARIRLERDGKARLWIGSSPGGHSHLTVAAQVLADRLGWPLDQIEVVAGDTRETPHANGTVGSRTAVQVGNATAMAAASARRRLLERAAEVLEADVADLLLHDALITVRGAPGVSMPATEAIPLEGLEVLEKFTPEMPIAYASGCHVAQVAVDPETGSVDLLGYVIVHDSGKLINPMVVEGQIHGGLSHGLGYALLEEAIYMPDGSFPSATFLDYSIPSPSEMAITPHVLSIETPTGANPEGFKGAGESGTIPAPAAIANAIEDALRRIDSDIVVGTLPITPDRIYRLLTRME
jgi:carbon-monoxide dehydrogenase large subunit